MINIEVEYDNKPVIPESEHLQITRRFYKIESRSEQSESDIKKSETPNLIDNKVEKVEFKITIPKLPYYKNAYIEDISINVTVKHPNIFLLLAGPIRTEVTAKVGFEKKVKEKMEDTSIEFYDLLKKSNLLHRTNRTNPILSLVSEITVMKYETLLEGAENLKENLEKLRDGFESALKEQKHSKSLQEPSFHR